MLLSRSILHLAIEQGAALRLVCSPGYSIKMNYLADTFKSTLLATMILIVLTTLTYADTKKPAVDLEKAVGVLELRIQMAENSLKFFNNTVNLVELVSSLEEYINGKCFGTLHKTLQYMGPPTDPVCVGYMERLLQINPDNPAAICLRDGISAPSCLSAYQNQKTEPYYSGAFDAQVPSPALKSGIPALELERLDKLTLTLQEVNSKYQSTEEQAEKSRLMDDALALYEQLLGTACRMTAIRFVPRSDSTGESRDTEIEEIREKLLKIPLKLRSEHQERMLSETENRFAAAKNNKPEQEHLKALMEAIRNPGGDGILSVQANERVRLILPKCKELIDQCLAAFPKSPAPACHRDGWFTPNCIRAIQAYRIDQQQRQAAALKGPPGSAVSTPIAPPQSFSKF